MDEQKENSNSVALVTSVLGEVDQLLNKYNMRISVEDGMCFAKRLRDARQFKKIANACLSFVTIKAAGKDKDNIPFTRNGNEIQVGKFGDRKDELSGLYLDRLARRRWNGE